MSRVLLLLDHHENRRLLAGALTPHYDVIAHPSDEALAGDFDVGIVDGVALDRLGPQLQARKQAELPAFLPFLFVASRRDVGMATRHLWKSIDELIFSPIEKVELLARVRGLYERRRASLEYNRFILRTSTNAILLLDREGRVIQWNPSAERIFGWSETDALGKLPLFIEREDDEEFRQMLNTVRQGGEYEGIEQRRLRKDGSAVDVISAATPLRDANGMITHVVCVLADITQSKRALELQRRRLHELEALDHITSILRQARTVNEALPILLDETLATLGFPAGCIWLYSPSEVLSPPAAGLKICAKRQCCLGRGLPGRSSPAAALISRANLPGMNAFASRTGNTFQPAGAALAFPFRQWMKLSASSLFHVHCRAKSNPTRLNCSNRWRAWLVSPCNAWNYTKPPSAAPGSWKRCTRLTWQSVER